MEQKFGMQAASQILNSKVTDSKLAGFPHIHILRSQMWTIQSCHPVSVLVVTPVLKGSYALMWNKRKAYGSYY